MIKEERIHLGKGVMFVLITLGVILFSTSVSADISACGTISSSGPHTLDNDVSSTAGCFNISASNVDFDCLGRRITGNDDASIFLKNSATNITVNVNGDVTNNTVINNTARVQVRLHVDQNATIIVN